MFGQKNLTEKRKKKEKRMRGTLEFSGKEKNN